MFLPIKSDNGASLPLEYFMAAAGAYQPGQLLEVSGGLLTAIAASTDETPPYVCMTLAEIAAGTSLAVYRISDDWIYESELGEDIAGLAVGDKLEVEAGGLTAVGADGCFEVVQVYGELEGDRVRGRFV